MATGQGRLLSEGFPFTVFAPTNAAFEALLASLGVSLDVALLDNVDLLKTVLRYHILEDAVMAADITDGAFVQTLQGELIGLTVLMAWSN